MALIRYGEGQQRSGSLGATVYSHNRFGQYIRARSVPTNPNTLRQQLQRQIFALLTVYWNQSLTDGERAGWSVYAENVSWINSLGDVIKLNGLNMFVRTNTLRLLLSQTVLDAAPAEFNLGEAPANVTGAIDVSADTLTVEYDNTEGWAGEVGGFLLVFMGRPCNNTINFFGASFRFVGSEAGLVVPPTSPKVFSVISGTWPVAAGQKVFMEVEIIRADGRVSPRVRTSFLAVA